MTSQNNRRKPGAPWRVAAPTGNATMADAAEVRDGFGVAAVVQRQALQRLERLCAEGFRFASTRLEENHATLHQLVHTPNLPDRVTIWGRHVERTVRQYSDNLGTLAGIYREQVRESVQEGADAAQAAVAGVAEVTPSPMVEAVPPLYAPGPGAVPKATHEAAPGAATRSGTAPAEAPRH
jgi:hypothetical protein